MWLQRNLTHFWTIWLIKLYVAKKAIKDLSVYKLWLSMKQMKRMFITLLKFYRTNQCRVYTLNHEKMFERRSWERTFLLKPKTPQTKELVPEIKEAWWSKQEMIYQLPLLPKWTPLLSVKLSVTQTQWSSSCAAPRKKSDHAWKLFSKIFKHLSSVTCHAYYRTNYTWTV